MGSAPARLDTTLSAVASAMQRHPTADRVSAAVLDQLPKSQDEKLSARVSLQ